MKQLSLFVKTKTTLILVSVFLVAGALFSVWMFQSADHQKRDDLLDQARLVTQALDVASIKTLSGSPDDLTSSQYQSIKQLLITLRAANSKYRFLYLMGRNSAGQIFFFVDSEPVDSPDYSAPGDIYAEASSEDYSVFDNKTANVEGPVSDHWGSWVSALTPLVDPVTGEVIAVVGMDVDAVYWNMDVLTRAALPVSLLLALWLVFSFVLLRRTQAALLQSEDKYRSMFTALSDGIIMQNASGKIITCNPAAAQMLGLTQDQMLENTLIDPHWHTIHADGSDFPIEMHPAALALRTGQAVRNQVMGISKPGGGVGWFNVNAEPMFNPGETSPYAALTSFADITMRVEVETVIQQEKQSLAKLLSVSQEFLENSAAELDVQKITDNLLEISGGKFAVFNLFDKNGKDFRTVAFSGLSEQFQKVTSMLGFDLKGKKWAHDPLREAKIRDNIITRFPSMLDLAGEVIQKPVMNLVKKIFKPGEAVVAKIFTSEQNLGDFTIIMPSGQRFAADNQVSIYVRQVGLLLQRTQAEAALRASQQVYRQLVEQVPEVIYTDEIGGSWRFLGPNIKSLCGYSAEELLADPILWLNMIQVEDRAELKAKVNSLVDGDVLNAEYQIKTRAGGFVWVRDHGVVIEDNATGTKLIQGLLADITKQKGNEAALEESDAKIRAIANSAMDAILMMDPQGKISYWNPAAETIFGYSHAEAIGQNLHNLIVPQRYHSDVNAALPAFLKTGEGAAIGKSLEMAACRKDGTEIPVQLSLSTFRLNDAWYAVGIISDITSRKQAEAEILESNRQLKETITRANMYAAQAELANIAKSEFLANMSHEIRTPMNGVIGMTGLLLDTNLDEEQRRYAEIVRSSGESLLTLINDILDFSKIEAGKLELELLDFDLLSMLDDFAATLAMRAHEKGLELLCAADPDVPALLQGDPGRLRQILTNLVGNAIKFTSFGEVAVRVTMSDLHPEIENQVELRFSIRDSGIGIPSEKLALLFNKFSQVDASTTRKFGGTGLGLAISKQLAELMGGSIGVNSQPGQGSEFWFTVRLRLQPVGRPESRNEAQTQLTLMGTRILVVDDNTTSREILNLRLTSWGMRNSEASGGAAALQALITAYEQDDPFQVAILDMQMPEMDGATLGQVIKSDPRLAGTHLVLLSSLGERGDARRFEQLGFEGYLTKPLRHADLFSVLSTALVGRAEAVEPGSILTRHSVREFQQVNIAAGTHILLAEDNITNQQVALGILKKFGLRADAAANGLEALKALENIPYDLVLMDVQMPEMDGLEATRRIRDPRSKVLNHTIPIIAMTAHAMQSDRDLCLQAGMNDYVSKPVNPQVLAETLERWLRLVGMTRPAAPANLPALAQEAIPAIEEIIPDKTVFDRLALMDRLLDDVELARIVVDGFVDDIPLQIQALKDFLKSGDACGAERQAHSIKGAAANIGAEALRAVAGEMEVFGKSGNLSAVRQRTGELEKQFVRLSEALEKAF